MSRASHRRSWRTAALLTAAALGAAPDHAARAAAISWDDGGGDLLWSTANNWNPDGVPNAAADITFPTTIPNGIGTITLASGELANSLIFNNQYTLTGGNLALTAGNGGNITCNSGAIPATINSALIGTAGLTKLGTGDLALGGANTFTGTVTISAGSLMVDTNARLGNTANGITINGGTLEATSTFSSARAVTLGASGGRIVANAGNTLTLTTALTANANALTVGSGTVALSAASTRTGTTLVQLSTLRLNNGSGAGTGAISANLAGVVELNGVTVANPLTLSINGTLRGLGASAYQGTITAAASTSPLILSTGTLATDTLSIGNAANDYTGGSGSTTFINGSGKVILSFSNDYAGSWQINSGTLRIGNVAALGGGTSAVVVNAGTLELSLAGGSLARPIALNNGGAVAASGTAGTSGVITVGSNAAATLGSSATILLGVGDGANDLTGGGGTAAVTVISDPNGKVVLNQPSDVTAAWTVDVNSSLQVDADDRLGAAANAVTLSNGATFIANDTFTSARTFTSNGGKIAVAVGKTLTLTSALAAGSGALTKSDFGTLVLAANSTRSGATTINAGVVSAGGTFNALGSGTITINSTGTLEVANSSIGSGIVLNGGGVFRGTGAGATWGSSMTIANAATVNIQAPAPGDVFTVGTVTNGIAGGTGSTINVTGNLGTGGGVTIFQTANTYAGGWNVTDNTLRVGNASALGSGTSAVVLNNNATLELTNITLDRAITMNNGSTLRGTGAAAAANGTATIAAGAVIALATGTTATDVFTLGNAANDLTGGNASSQINVTGAGTIVLTQSSNVIGNWSLNSGTLRLTADSRLGNAANVVTLNGGTLEATSTLGLVHTITPNGGTLSANGAIGITVSSALGAGSGSLNTTGSGIIFLEAASLRTGNTTISSGTLHLDNAIALGTAGTGTTTVAATGALEIQNVTVDKPLTLSASGATLRGTGTSASYIGTISIPTNVQPVIATGVSSTDVLTLGDAANDLTGGGGSSQINVNGSGKVVLTQASDYTGQWFLASTLQASADNQLGNTANNLFLNGVAATFIADGTFAMTRTVITNNGTINVSSGQTLTITSSISGGATQALHKAGSGQLTAAGGGSLNSTATIDGGVLRLAGSSITSGPYTVNAATLEIGGFNLASNITLNPNSNLRGTGISAANGTINVVGIGSVTLNTGTSASDVFTIGNGPNDLTGGALSPMTIRALGAGTIVLAQSSDYQGDWSIEGGVVKVNNAASFGTSNDAIDATGGTIAPNGISISNIIALNGATLADASTSTPATFAGSIVGSTGTSTIALTVPNTSSSQSVVISGAITMTNTLNITNTAAGAGAAAIFTNPGNNLLTGPIVVAANARLTSNPTNKTGSTLGSGSLTLSGGTLNLLSNADTSYGRNVTVSTASGTIFVDRVDAAGGTAHTLTLNSLLVNSSQTLMVNSADDYNLATGPLNLTGTAALIQSAGTGVYVTGNVTGAGHIRTGDTGITTTSTLSQLMETGVHFKNGVSFSIQGALQQVNTNIGTPVVGAENAGTVVNWSADWVNDVGAGNASFIVAANGGTFRFGSVANVDTAINVSTFTPINVVGDGTGTFELVNGFLAFHNTSSQLGDLHIGNVKLKTNTTSNLPTHSIVYDLADGGAWQTVTDSQTFAGTLSMLRNTTLQTDTDLVLGGPLSIGDGSNTNKVATKTGGGTLTIAGAQTHGSGATLTVSAGALVMNSDAGSASSRILSVNASGGNATFNTTEHLAGLSVSAASTATLAADTTRVIVTDAVAATSGGRIDLKDNKLIVKSGTLGTFNGAAYTGITGLIAFGYNGGTQDGTGIVTSQSSAVSPNSLTSLAVARAEDAGYAGGTFSGQSVVAGDVLVMYTWAGDANLDGVINGDDYFQIDSGFPQGLSGWFNGDFNYDGVINGDDYFVIDSNFPAQGPAFSTGAGAGAGSGVVAIPEPASIAGVITAAAALGRRRRRGRSAG